MGGHLVAQMNRLNGPARAESGIHYAHEYRNRAAAYKRNPAAHPDDKGYSDFWKEDYADGYAEPADFERIGHMAWRLLPGVSAAKGLRDWLKGPTIAECATALVAIETDTFRAVIGNPKFDQLFSDLPPTKALLGRLVLSPRSEEGSIFRFLQETPAAAADPTGPSLPDRRPVKKGDWYFFYNHPAYALKHPAGAGQGENAICMDATPGRQRWAGLGITANNESEMLKVLADLYNEPRTEQDYLWLLEQFAPKVLARKPPSQTYREAYRRLRNKRLIPDPYREEKGAFPTRDITWEDILKAPAIQVDGEPRRGGFSIRSGKTLRM